jgi:hypothetical protein
LNMKMPDFSKAAMQKFFLYHTEKLILVVAIISMAAFFWIGFGIKPYSDKSPDDLVKMAKDAERYIESATSWDDIKSSREGRKNVDQIVRDGGKVDASIYQTDPFTGIAARTLDARLDPSIFGIIDPEAVVFTAPLLIDIPRNFDQFASYPSAPSSGEEEEDSTGLGGFDGGSDPLSDGGEEEPDGEEEGGFSGGRGGGAGGLGESEPQEEEEANPIPVLDGVGTKMQTVNVHTSKGVRPTHHNFPATTTSAIFNIVCVTGLVDVDQQWKEYENSFASAMGYYPDRDKPTYQYLEVERRELGEEKWSNITDDTSHYFPSLFPSMHRMPKAFYSSAPDVVAPQHYDPVLTGPIPAIFNFDYRPFVTHSRLVENRREFPEFTEEEEAKAFDVDDILKGNIPTKGQSGASSGGNAGKFGGGMGMGMGMGAGGMGDPGGGGRGGSATSGSGGDFATEAPEIVQSRIGSDFTDHMKAVNADKAQHQFRLVRFFDFHQKEVGKTYEYRMRLWIGDPNNEDLGKQFANRQTRGMTDLGSGLSGGGGGGTQGSDEDDSADQEDDPNGDGGYAADQPSGSDPASSEAEAKYVRITSTMRNPNVRKRLNRAKEKIDSKTNVTTYFVSEVRGKDDQGNDKIEEIKVPRVAVAKNNSNNGDKYAYQDYLQHARPSQWSAPVTVKVQQTRGQVAAGSVTPGKTLRLSQDGSIVELPVGEVEVEVAASAWWDKNLGTALPTKQNVHRGDALDFIAESYFLHPATLEVKVAKNAPDAEGPNQYKVPITTGMVVVDAISGAELELPRTEKMRHQTASEILIMDDNGNFRVKNDMYDRTQFRNMLHLADESQTVGKGKKRKKSKDNEESPGGGGKFGNGGGEGGF